MMRATPLAVLVGLCAGLAVLAAPSLTRAQTASATTLSRGSGAEEFSAQSRREVRRVPRRVPIYRGSTYPGPNSVRICNAHYEQEFRPSGTVIVPRMHCYWSG
jgi:hypothetical protein